MNAEPFAEKFYKKSEVIGPLVVGIDPSEAMVKNAMGEMNYETLRQFCFTIIAACKGTVAAVKVNHAFFEQPKCSQVLDEVLVEAKRQGLLIILDRKIADIGSTADAIVDSYIPNQRVDAITATTQFGFGEDGLLKSMNTVGKHNAGMFFVLRASNSSSKPAFEGYYQNTPLHIKYATELNKFNYNFNNNSNYGPLMSVIGATITDPQTTLGPLYGNNVYKEPILSPGFGAQGATFENLNHNWHAYRKNLMPSVSRAIVPDIFNVENVVAQINSWQNKALTYRDQIDSVGII